MRAIWKAESSLKIGKRLRDCATIVPDCQLAVNNLAGICRAHSNRSHIISHLLCVIANYRATLNWRERNENESSFL